MQSKVFSIVILTVVSILICAVVIQHVAIRLGYSQIAELRTQNEIAMEEVAALRLVLSGVAQIEPKLQKSIRDLLVLQNLMTLALAQAQISTISYDHAGVDKGLRDYEHYAGKWITERNWLESLADTKTDVLQAGGK